MTPDPRYAVLSKWTYLNTWTDTNSVTSTNLTTATSPTYTFGPVYTGTPAIGQIQFAPVQFQYAPTPPLSQFVPMTPPPMPEPPPAFNAFLNASDLMERFIAFAKGKGVRQSELLSLPIELFLNWLVIEAAEADGEPRPEGVVLQFPPRKALRSGRRRHRRKEKVA